MKEIKVIFKDCYDKEAREYYCFFCFPSVSGSWYYMTDKKDYVYPLCFDANTQPTYKKSSLKKAKKKLGTKIQKVYSYFSVDKLIDAGV